MRSQYRGARPGRIPIFRTEVPGVVQCNGYAYLKGKSTKPGEIILLPRTRWNRLRLYFKIKFHLLKKKFYARHKT
jgi:hypothetical protein